MGRMWHRVARRLRAWLPHVARAMCNMERCGGVCGLGEGMGRGDHNLSLVGITFILDYWRGPQVLLEIGQIVAFGKRWGGGAAG